MNDIFEAVIGIEVHIALSTVSKVFCSCMSVFGDKPNTHVCPVCMGLPGALPSLNREAVEYTVRAGMLTHCQIAQRCRMDRKNYFYPDLPKAYQISQNTEPLCRDGYVEIVGADGGSRRIGIARIHLEEDAGKLVHDASKGTLIDYNRSGTPLAEIVSYPDIRNSEEAMRYLTQLRIAMVHGGISECRMDKGEMRCDVNVSVRRRGSDKLGTKCEIKNINSIAFVGKAIKYEVERQTELLLRGAAVCPETRRFDAVSGKTVLMRAKENPADYRYFGEPDLPIITISDGDMQRIRACIPETAEQRLERYVSDYGVRISDAEIFVAHKSLGDFFDRVAELTKYRMCAASFLLSDVLSRTSAEGFEPGISPENVALVVDMFAQGEINSSVAKRLLAASFDGKNAREVVEEQGLIQINDVARIERELVFVTEHEPRMLEDYRRGKTAAKKAIIGRVMSRTSGLANPKITDACFEHLFGGTCGGTDD